MNWSFHENELDRADVRALLAQHFAEMRAGSPPSACHVLTADALKDRAIRFFTVRNEAASLFGCGALKRLAADHGEIKSMRTADAALGRGVGRRLLDHITTVAQVAGMTRLSLETGTGDLFAAANLLYQREGYVPTGPFGGYVRSDFTTFYTREI